METRNWYPGFQGNTKKGDFIVLRLTDQGYLVQYTSGEWKGTFINMPKEIGAETHQVEMTKIRISTKKQAEAFSDIFFEDFNLEFDSVWNRYEKTTGQAPTEIEMVELLRDAYPPLFQLILTKFLQKRS